MVKTGAGGSWQGSPFQPEYREKDKDRIKEES